MRGKFVLTAFVVFGFVLAGCNTVAGMGKDVSRAGNAITNAADK
ncbi:MULTISPECIES: entericidin A/B family lipoprotein [Achromobacter]|jgi:predicted small secreted protein|uniref:Entericidin, EcnA/B family n=2 Tax=Achromobacter TaxID=222 RepID=A0A2S0I4W0_9BURK|nr:MULTISPECIES: entericidin A/B family lipoprotein [Achromobacter]AVJ27080.1 entericidin, EcnA/B family [Achromobacter spanius]KQZ98673.1 entericidin [Achromobacter sp. Root565]MBV7503186.1 entericidin A/B family lipoprotein [Achromobacter sp. ACM05]MCG7324368.1 entericidin A/B family lipoprotein [Achromobacter sp. ACRQX]MDH0683165.1 entericidin A/B family lipoprotein [Achromobacter animicus]